EFVVTGQTFQVRNNLPQDLAQHVGAQTDAAPFTTTLQTQRRGIPLTPAYADTPLAKPKSRGVQTATVVGPAEPTDQV
ncbi:hypothetical protein, partial [Chromobacterium amazonense]|uniref:hypothetical protein n=1 Tax=Chromobacterium amazonense TaxID=1382803 RepID=UPI003F7B03E4